MEIPGYEIHKQLGSGGMSTVYLATQKTFDRKVALKVLLPTYASNENFTSRFIRESKIVAGLSHPHIVPVSDVGNYGDNYYLAMDYLAGGDLAQWIERGLVEDEVLQVIEDIADALQFAHSKGFIHRDIKPDNIMFREDSSAVLADFGIARLQNANDQLTQDGSVVGTPKYMAPEILQGHDVDGRADIYSLGVVLYEMLTKETPYQADNYMTLGMKHVNDPLPDLPLTYAHLQPLLHKMMAKNPEDRFKNGLEVVKAVKSIRKGESIMSDSVSGSAPMIEGELNADLDNMTVGDTVPKNRKEVDTQADTEEMPVLNINDDEYVDTIMKSASSAEKDVTEDVDEKENPTVKKVNRESAEEKQQRMAKRPKEQTVHGEIKQRKLLSTCFLYSMEMVNYDPVSFSAIFSTATSKMLEWKQERGKKAGGLYLKVTGTPGVFRRARSAVDELYNAGGVFEFLQKGKVILEFVEVDSGETETIVFGKK